MLVCTEDKLYSKTKISHLLITSSLQMTITITFFNGEGHVVYSFDEFMKKEHIVSIGSFVKLQSIVVIGARLLLLPDNKAKCQ